ncbi:autotransporter assembly complex protein TamA [Thorsellia kenyensis]|uniref:Translocation and assembly module subunit TamA n=1 Tax=Thorsellia kenyensis TaxID=1549888 RepID=A0ABV6C829_9GAMM
MNLVLLLPKKNRCNENTIKRKNIFLRLGVLLSIIFLSGCQLFSNDEINNQVDPSSKKHQRTIRIQLTGLEGELQRNVRARLSRIQEAEISSDGRFQARLRNEIVLGLKALGYYSPEIQIEFEDKLAPARPILHANVSPGKPVLLVRLDINIKGEAKDDEAFQQLITRLSPELNKPINHSQFDAFTAGLTNLALNRGYFDAIFIQQKLGVSVERGEAIWFIEFDSGERYRYGNITYDGSQIDTLFLDNLTPFEPAVGYLADDIIEFNRRLNRTNWFNSSIMTPRLESLNNDKTVDIGGVLTPRTKNSVDVGLGFSTDVGIRGVFSWRRPWWNRYGHSSETNLNISTKEQIIDFNYRIPLVQNALDHYYIIQTGYKRQDLNDTRSDAVSINFARFWGRILGWQFSTNIRLSYDDFIQGATQNSTLLVMPGITLNRTRTVGSGMPEWGDTQRYSLDFSDKVLGSDADLAIMQGQYALIRTPAAGHRLLGRTNIGWIETNKFDVIPPSLRFFAGGDRSIRGYKFRGISPRDEAGKLAGASQLLTGSLEYQYNFTGNWWGATFVDAGNASNKVLEDDIKTGTGIGVRWSSPLGPVRFDIATPVNDRDTNNVQFYIGLGPEL